MWRRDHGQKDHSTEKDFPHFKNLSLYSHRFVFLTGFNGGFCTFFAVIYFLCVLFEGSVFPSVVSICSTWFFSQEVFDCMFLHLLTHSCASPCFAVSCLSPEMLHRIPYTLSQKTCFTGGLLDQRKLQFFRSGS